jgi:3-oxoacyl-[acyl-carrier protein] reductase
VLINNAAVIHNEMLISFTAGGLKKHDFSSWNNIISANLTSVFNITSHVVFKMVNNRKKGLIVNVSSIASDGNIGQSAYSASKAGINALTVTWAKELASMGIRVAGISPGFTRTETTMNSMTESVVNEWIKKTPVKRMACPAEIVEGIIFIIKNDFFNGEILKLDGGLRI